MIDWPKLTKQRVAGTSKTSPELKCTSTQRGGRDTSGSGAWLLIS
jgi:hypothetical protein